MEEEEGAGGKHYKKVPFRVLASLPFVYGIKSSFPQTQRKPAVGNNMPVIFIPATGK